MDCAPDRRGLAGWPELKVRPSCSEAETAPICRRVKFGSRLSTEVRIDALVLLPHDLDNSVRSGSKDSGPEVGDSVMTNTALSPATPLDFPRGMAVLRDPLLNKGTAFTENERDALGLRGLLPAHVLSLEEQAARVLEQHAPLAR